MSDHEAAPDWRPRPLPGLKLPYQPIRQELYTPAELFQGFVSDEPASFTRTLDFAIYRHFVAEGGSVAANPYSGMMQALHDNAITQSMRPLIAGRKVAAIMGGHKMARDSAAYRDVAVLARRLARSGIVMCTGGGPGAMEATHLGASLAGAPDSDLDGALAALAVHPVVPELARIVDASGSVDVELMARAHAWFAPAHEIAASMRSPGASLAVPTWHFGHEPTTPFATNIAKYFQNSIREEGMLALATQGIVYAQGKAGTLQEIFQDGAQNYYRTFGHFSPMVLLGAQYWTTTYPVVGVLANLFGPTDFARHVLVTDDIDAAARFVEGFVP